MIAPPRIAVSQYAVLIEPIRDGLARLAQTGIPGLEIFMEGPQWWTGRALEGVEAVRTQFAGGLSIHPPAWEINIASYTKPVRDTAIEVYARTIEWARRMRATYIVVHIGWRGDASLPRSACLARAEDALRALAPRAAAAGVALAVENVGWSGQEICDQGEFTAVIGRLPPGAGALLDVGHALLAGWDLPAAVRDLAPRMIALHLHDNHGDRDAHLPIGDGRIDWNAILPPMRALRGDCQHVLEYAPGTPLDRLRQGATWLRGALAPAR